MKDVKAKAREYLSAHPGWHDAFAIAQAIEAPTIDTMEALLDLTKEGVQMKPAGATP